jgi:NAD dependent epimerase/dehydratase family enzyme
VPAFAVRAAVGARADYLRNGRKVMPRALAKLGFAYAHPSLDEAVRSSLRK